MIGDGYAGLIDHIQPPLFLLFIGSLGLSLFISGLFYFFSLPLLITLLLLNLPMAVSIIKRKREKVYLLFIFLAFLRGIVRSIGMFSGIFRFFILEPSLKKEKQVP
jgi:hypothetical protein